MFAGFIVALLAVFAVVATAVVSRPALSVRLRWLLLSTALAGTITAVLCVRGSLARERQVADERVYYACSGFKSVLSGYRSWLKNTLPRPLSLEQTTWWFRLGVGQSWDYCMQKPVVCAFPGGGPPNEDQLDALMRAFETRDSCTPCEAFPDPAQRPRGCP